MFRHEIWKISEQFWSRHFPRLYCSHIKNVAGECPGSDVFATGGKCLGRSGDGGWRLVRAPHLLAVKILEEFPAVFSHGLILTFSGNLYKGGKQDIFQENAGQTDFLFQIMNICQSLLVKSVKGTKPIFVF